MARSLWSYLTEWAGLVSRAEWVATDVALLAELERIEKIMGVREDAADQRQRDLIELIRAGRATDAEVIAGLIADKSALTTERDELRTALEAANADQAAAIDAAVLADRETESDADADRQETVNTALEEIAGTADPGATPLPPAEPDAPADSGVDGGSDDGTTVNG